MSPLLTESSKIQLQENKIMEPNTVWISAMHLIRNRAYQMNTTAVLKARLPSNLTSTVIGAPSRPNKRANRRWLQPISMTLDNRITKMVPRLISITAEDLPKDFTQIDVYNRNPYHHTNLKRWGGRPFMWVTTRKQSKVIITRSSPQQPTFISPGHSRDRPRAI